ncbi:MAG: 23S rRNA (guanosine(2251)-2'-O)-methyltransferase RlmB [Chloroflexi bacterium]|nr:MAG: 23S rRNA (guanosine(2251)-2'-O)-methyltransferase RlmB [Chloroflexota bacterium]
MSNYLMRRNTVLEALRGDRRDVYRLWLQKGLDRRLTQSIFDAAKARNVPIKTATKQQLGHMAQDSSHQGVLLEVGQYRYSDLDEILNLAVLRNEKPFLLLLDLLHGPQNIGALIRTAEICGVHGVILQDRRAPDITTAVSSFSVGATEHLLIAQVTNLVQTIRDLQERHVWIVGLDMTENSQPLAAVDLDMPLGIVVGHEGQGLRRLVQKSCDLIVELPMRGHVESLNAAVAGSVMLYAAWGARGYAGSKKS